MTSRIEITLYEHEKKKYGELVENIDRTRLQNAFTKINKHFKGRLDLISNDNPDSREELDENKAVFEVYSNTVKARHYVGFAVVGNVFVQVLPKVFRPSVGKPNKQDDENTKNGKGSRDNAWDSLRAFIRMLNVAYGLKIREYDLAYLRGRKLTPNLYEVFIYLFANSLWKEIQRGYHREYVELQSEEKFLRGKLLLSRQIRKLPHQLNTFSVETHEFIEDNLLNRVLYASVKVALMQTSWRINKKLLEELMLVFDGLTPIRLTREHFERVHFTRLTERFRHPFELAKLLFMPPSSEGKEREVSGFFVDMNELFERFILQTLKITLPEYEVKYQRELNLFSRDKEKKGNIITKKQYPDFIISRNDIPIVVLDAKYRALGIKEGKLQISPDSLRQVYVYAKILENEKNIKGIKTILIFPKSDRYNNFKQELKVGEATFFDGTQISVLTYNMETLKSELNVDSKFQEKIRELLQNTGNHSNQSPPHAPSAA